MRRFMFRALPAWMLPGTLVLGMLPHLLWAAPPGSPGEGVTRLNEVPAAAGSGMARVSATASPEDGRPSRPDAAPLQVAPVSPQLQAVLEAWHQKTSQVRKLEGEHRRWKYELTFGVEKRSTGHFYYEAPDKGRIDIEAIDPKTDTTPPAKHPETGEPFALQADQPQQWVCDGQKVLQIHPGEKTYEASPVPPQLRGSNIMDGPLPFLFGMPPDKARQRYDITLSRETETQVVLKVKPRRPEDAANYQEADVILAKPAYLPSAVQLLDPSGNGRTVYTFGKLQVNSGGGVLKWFGADPFAPNLIGYKAIQTGPAEVVGAAGVPSTVGLEWRQAKTVLETRGYQVKITQGPPAPREELKYCVMQQHPAPRDPLATGGTVTLTVYNTPMPK